MNWCLAHGESAVVRVPVVSNTDISGVFCPVSDLSFRISSLAFLPLNEVTSVLLRELMDMF